MLLPVWYLNVIFAAAMFEYAEGEKSVTARRFIVMADYIDKLKCVKLNLLIVKHMNSSVISRVYSRINIKFPGFLNSMMMLIVANEV